MSMNLLGNFKKSRGATKAWINSDKAGAKPKVGRKQLDGSGKKWGPKERDEAAVAARRLSSKKRPKKITGRMGEEFGQS
jgi:hypothetical protein